MSVRRRKPPKPRDYTAKYRRRSKRNLQSGGLPKADHGKTGRRRTKASRVTYGEQFEKALRALRVLKNQRIAAESNGLSPRRFRRFLRENRLAHFRNGKWRFTDKRIRSVQAFTTRGKRQLKVKGFKPASTVMFHLAAVESFLAAPDLATLEPYVGLSVTDAEGRAHRLETRPNVLYRLSAAGGESYEEIYRLTT
jgi:hypothetical protein